MTAFHLSPGTHAPRLRKHLWEKHRIEVPIVERPNGLLVRVSTHFYNTEAEIDHLTKALFSEPAV
jgi:isopenicillin-N epimerase